MSWNPDTTDLGFWGEGEYSDYTIANLITAASGIIVGTNPSYSEDDFLAIYPQFSGNVPDAVMGAFIALASACLSEARWKDAWQLGMALFIAHYCTLHLQTVSQTCDAMPTAKQAYSAGLAKGIAVSKSVGDVSVSYQVPQGLEDWGAWTLTVFGTQLAQMARVIGTGILWIY